jgi:membrane-associated phospholipid phosphatase
MFETRLANIISYLFHPLLMPVYVLILFFNVNIYYSTVIPDYSKIRIIGLVFITTFLFPLLINLILKRKGFLSSLFLNIREERLLPFIVTAVFYYMTYQLFRQLYLPDFYNLYLLGATILILIVLIINFYWKISLHMLAIGGMTGIFMGLAIRLGVIIPYLIISIIFISGLIGFSRLKLNAHKPGEVYGGYLIGFTVLFLVLLYF